MRTTFIVTLALLVAFSAAASNATVGTNCSSDVTLCSTANAAYCCASLNVSTFVTATKAYTYAVQTVCVNQTVLTAANGKYISTVPVLNATGSCIATAANNSLFVKLSIAVASLGFLSLFL